MWRCAPRSARRPAPACPATARQRSPRCCSAPRRWPCSSRRGVGLARGRGDGFARLAFAAWVVVAALATTAAAVLVLRMHGEAGLAPVRDAWSATVATLLAWQVLHAVVLGAMAAYLLARIGKGLIGPRSRATLDNVALYGQGAMLQGVLGIALVQWLPRVLG